MHYVTLSSVKRINWNTEKNQTLITERGISFEDILFAIQSGDLLDDVTHHNVDKYSHQKMFVINVEGYDYLVPYVETIEEIFLKTIIPSRKATKKYLQGGGGDE